METNTNTNTNVVYGLVEVEVETIRKAYVIIHEVQNRANTGEEGFISRIKDMLFSNGLREKYSSYTKEECTKIRDMLAEIVYASYISTSGYMLIKIELASIIQDIITNVEIPTSK